MSTIFVRPGHLHTAAKVLSASSEAGLIAGPATPATANIGKLRLRTSGAPWTTLDGVVQLQSGGAPAGYATGNFGIGAGAAALWRFGTDSATTKQRGYNDSIYVTRVMNPIDYVAAMGSRRCSTPRELPDGYLGIASAGTNGSAGVVDFTRISEAGAGTRVVIENNTYTGVLAPDFVVLPSGRLVLICGSDLSTGAYVGTAGNIPVTWYSDDYGVTWSQLSLVAIGQSVVAPAVLSMEVVGDDICLIMGAASGGAAVYFAISRDGGSSFSVTDNGTRTDSDPRLCKTMAGTLIYTYRVGATYGRVHRIVVGGAISSDTISLATSYSYGGSVVTERDDGTLWAITTGTGAAYRRSFDMLVSLDDGLTWASATGSQVLLDMDPAAAPASDPWIGMRLGTWRGRLVLVFTSLSPTGGATEDVIQVVEFGGWAQVCDRRDLVASKGQPYEYAYIPTEYPDNVGWSLATFGARPGLASITNNEDGLHMVSDATGNSTYTASATVWSAVAGDGRRLRFRTRVASGGSRTADVATVYILIADGVNGEGLIFRFDTTGARVVDLGGTTRADLTFDHTQWVEWLVSFRHDGLNATTGQCSAWYRLAADTEGTWTQAMDGASVPEIVVATSVLRFGGTSSAASNWRLAFLAVANDDNDLYRNFSITSLPGRPLSYAADYYLAAGVHLGGYGTAGVAADTYDVDTTYSYGKENLWREFRPSRQWRTAADNTAANVVFDAASTDKFKGDTVAIIGTNYRTATLQFALTDSWGSPALSVALDATVDTFTISAAGPGFVGPSVSKNWRPGRFRSDGDAHRWFLQVASTVYEITDNDEDRIYVGGVDLSGTSGTSYIFCDRMAVMLASVVQFRFARILIGSQDTADGQYRTGTPIFDKRFVPAQPHDHGFVDRIVPRVELSESDSGYRSAARIGPRRSTLAIQWPPLDSLGKPGDLALRIADFFSATDGSLRPILVWRDTTDLSTLMLCRIVGTYAGTGTWGERGTGVAAITRIEQLVLEEEN